MLDVQFVLFGQLVGLGHFATEVLVIQHVDIVFLLQLLLLYFGLLYLKVKHILLLLLHDIYLLFLLRLVLG